jgi:hypothetical protein
LYESNPFSPDPSEIARVTDYVVAYACKGNSTLTEEKRQIKQKSVCYDDSRYMKIVNNKLNYQSFK